MHDALRGAGRIGRTEAFHRITEVLHCKWTLAVLEVLVRGPHRPSEIQQQLPGLTAKVLNERLRKLEGYGVVSRSVFAEVPPRVEYELTDRGRGLASLIRTVSAFVDDWAE